MGAGHPCSHDFSGLTDEQRAFLWGTVYTSEW
nr:MAG TPA: hypothetical protein [Caudoviricetes sp.]